MNLKRLFYNFLQKHNALRAYKRAFEATQLKSERKLKEYVSLGCSFIWAATPEGHEYWQTLDAKWFDHFNSIKRKYHF